MRRTLRFLIGMAGAGLAIVLVAPAAGAVHQPPGEDSNPCGVDGHRVFFSQEQKVDDTQTSVLATYYIDGYLALSYDDGGDVAPGTGYIEVDGGRQSSESTFIITLVPNQLVLDPRAVERPDVRSSLAENGVDPDSTVVYPLYEQIVPEHIVTTPGVGPYPLVSVQQTTVQYKIGPQGQCVSVAGVRVL